MISLQNIAPIINIKKDTNIDIYSKAYAIAQNGTFIINNNSIGKFVTKTENMPSLEALNESFTMKLPKIPFNILVNITEWFKAIYAKYKTESTAIIMWNDDEGYSIFIPKQKNTTATSNYSMGDDPEYMQYCQNHMPVLVAHSHPWKGSSSPSPSGTDDRDEKEAMLYLIANNVEEIPHFYASTCPNGVRYKLNVFEIFENPVLDFSQLPDNIAKLLKSKLTEDELITEAYNALETRPLVPEEWFSKATTASSSTKYDYSKYTQKNDTKIYDYRDKQLDFFGYDFDYDDDYSVSNLDNYYKYRNNIRKYLDDPYLDEEDYGTYGNLYYNKYKKYNKTQENEYVEEVEPDGSATVKYSK